MIIRVIQIDGQFVTRFAYSSGKLSFNLSDNILHAMNLLESRNSPHFIEELFGSHNDKAVVKEYEITITEIR